MNPGALGGQTLQEVEKMPHPNLQTCAHASWCLGKGVLAGDNYSS